MIGAPRVLVAPILGSGRLAGRILAARVAEGLLLVDPDDLDGFARAIASCLDAREEVLASQEAVREFVVERGS